MNRLEQIRMKIDDLLNNQPDMESRRCGFVHLYGVAQTCTLLALSRGQDPELYTLAGMFHDIATYHSGNSSNHAQRSADFSRKILCEAGSYSEEEIEAVCRAISCHSEKESQQDGLLAETLKDADVLQHHLYHPALDMVKSHGEFHVKRLERTLVELSGKRMEK